MEVDHMDAYELFGEREPKSALKPSWKVLATERTAPAAKGSRETETRVVETGDEGGLGALLGQVAP
jgi:hypothetical protein